MSVCIIRADCPIDNIFFTFPIFRHRAGWLNSWHPRSLRSRFWRDGGGFCFARSQAARTDEVKPMTDATFVAIAPAVCERLLGDPSGRSRREWRWGRKGSFRLTLDTGTWNDFEAGEGGGVLSARDAGRTP